MLYFLIKASHSLEVRINANGDVVVISATLDNTVKIIIKLKLHIYLYYEKMYLTFSLLNPLLGGGILTSSREINKNKTIDFINKWPFRHHSANKLMEYHLPTFPAISHLLGICLPRHCIPFAHEDNMGDCY